MRACRGETQRREARSSETVLAGALVRSQSGLPLGLSHSSTQGQLVRSSNFLRVGEDKICQETAAYSLILCTSAEFSSKLLKLPRCCINSSKDRSFGTSIALTGTSAGHL